MLLIHGWDIFALIPLLAWIAMLTARGGFWRVKSQLLPRELRGRTARVAVVIPARDEAANVGAAVESLVGQMPCGMLHVFLVDDGSTDGTASVARAAAERVGRSDALTVIAGEPLPPDWSGKLWAVEQGIDSAKEFLASPTGDIAGRRTLGNEDSVATFLLMTDADIVHEEGSVAKLVELAEREGYDMVSLMVRLVCESTAERLLIPAFVYFFFLLYPPRWIRDRGSRTAGAAGGCMLIRPEALERAGGIDAIRGEIIDDCSLAAALKRSGGRVWLGLADGSKSVRPYGTWSGIGNMIARAAFRQLHHSALWLAGALAGLTLCFVLPVLLLFGGAKVLAALGGIAWLLMAMSYLPMIRFYGLNAVWAATLPASAIFYMGATVVSAVRFWSGRGGQWKGRVQDR